MGKERVFIRGKVSTEEGRKRVDVGYPSLYVLLYWLMKKTLSQPFTSGWPHAHEYINSTNLTL